MRAQSLVFSLGSAAVLFVACGSRDSFFASNITWTCESEVCEVNFTLENQLPNSIEVAYLIYAIQETGDTGAGPRITVVAEEVERSTILDPGSAVAMTEQIRVRGTPTSIRVGVRRKYAEEPPIKPGTPDPDSPPGGR